MSKKLKKTRKHKLVWVLWQDAVVDLNAPWRSYRDMKKWARTEQFMVDHVGYLTFEDPDFIVLAASYCPHLREYGSLMKIPRGCIIEMRKLKTGKKLK